MRHRMLRTMARVATARASQESRRVGLAFGTLQAGPCLRDRGLRDRGLRDRDLRDRAESRQKYNDPDDWRMIQALADEQVWR